MKGKSLPLSLVILQEKGGESEYWKVIGQLQI